MFFFCCAVFALKLTSLVFLRRDLPGGRVRPEASTFDEKKKKNLFFKLPLFLLTAEAKKKKKREREETVFACGEAARWRSESLQSSPSSGVDLFFLFCLVINFSFFFPKSPLSPPVPALCSLYVLPENAVASGRASVVRPLPKPELLSQIARRSRASVGQRQRKGRPVGLQLDRTPPRGDFRRGLR